MRKNFCILLCCLSTAFLLAACGNTETDGGLQTEMEAVSEIGEALPEDISSEAAEAPDEYSDEYYLEQARLLGIADESYYDHLDQPMTHVEYFTMLKNAHDLQYGEDSNCYIDGWLYYMTEGENDWEGVEPVKLGRIIDIAAMADAVYFRGVERDFKSDFWGAMDGLWDETNIAMSGDYLWDSHYMRLGLNEEGCITSDPYALVYNSDELQETNWVCVSYICSKFDRVSYDYLYTMPEDYIFPENDTMTLKDGILFTFHYYRSLYPEAEYVCIDDAGTYNEQIITEDLLKKETTLPEASNQKLPGEWHGISYNYQNATWGALGGHSDWFMNERDFQEIHDSGFNFVRIWTSWYHLLSPYMNTDNPVRLDDETKNRTDIVNLSELEYWDQLIAWAIEYDVHIQICFTDTPGLDRSVFQAGWEEWFGTEYCTGEIFTNPEVQQVSAQWWRMLAKRYAAIPNTYLSFNLINEPDPESDEVYAEALRPSIEAIWEESPERVIVCDVETHMPITGEEMAKMGCALSCHEYIPHEFTEIHVDKAIEDPDYYTSMTWPYVDEDGNIIDAETAKDMVAYTVGSYNVIKETAENYDVGFMVNEFGYFQNGFWEDANWNPETDGNLPIQSTEVYQAFLRDKVEGYTQDDVAWVVGAWTGMYADTYTWPIEGAEWYEPENYHYVFDQRMQVFWKEINGVTD